LQDICNKSDLTFDDKFQRCKVSDFLTWVKFGVLIRITDPTKLLSLEFFFIESLDEMTKIIVSHTQNCEILGSNSSKSVQPKNIDIC
jgi:hypothetical protein